ncbi:hypothetical protein [Pseudomonas sp. Irchel 3E13]|uniref:hypothetical protein n=1 Tax=Pseudomonas sp. Irchel 3E13 TaxID=2008975 RepID=UPI000BA37C11|nr:hypothetical protein [Pseudomonas sp. Irchel 3E13]
MQQFTKPAIQIHVRGSAMIQLHFAGQCVGFAMTYRSAGHQAAQLESLLFAIRNRERIWASDTTTGVSFGSVMPEMSVGSVAGVTKQKWVVETDDSTPLRTFPSQEAAEWYRGAIQAYDRLLPPGGEHGEWSAAQIDWFRNHPAPIASACGGRLHVRQVGVH